MVKFFLLTKADSMHTVFRAGAADCIFKMSYVMRRAWGILYLMPLPEMPRFLYF